MSVQRRGKTWRVRWQDGGAWRSKTFDLKRDALALDTDLRRRRRLGTLAELDAGTETLDQYVAEVWTPTYAPAGEATRKSYASVYDHLLEPYLGSVSLRELSPELVARWQRDRLKAGAGPHSVRRALGLLGNILQRAVEGKRIPSNSVRSVRPSKLPRKVEVKPLSPAIIERMRAASSARDAALLSVLAYAGLRPGEALALRWGDIGTRTILVERAAAFGEVKDTKTGHHRSVRLLAPLKADLDAWRELSRDTSTAALVFGDAHGGLWTDSAWRDWRRRNFARALEAAGVAHARPYDLRHSFASLLLHEGRDVIDVARQLGHAATLTLTVYGHVIAELQDAPQQDAEEAIRAARASCAAHELPIACPPSAIDTRPTK